MQFDSAKEYGKIEKRLLRDSETILENQTLVDRIKTLESIIDELNERLEKQNCEIVKLHYEIADLKAFIGFKC